MTTEEMAALFEKHEDAYLKKPSGEIRNDLVAFNLLRSLVPSGSGIVSDAEHDEIFLNVDANKLAAVISEDNVLMLVQCGVRYNDDLECLCMFV